MKTSITLIVLVILMTVISTTASCQEIASPLEDYTWSLLEYGVPGGMKTTLPGTEVTALFDSKSKMVTGNGGCNDYSAPYETDHLTLKITGPLTQTKIYCGGDIDTQENEFFNFLKNADSFEMERGQLIIHSGISRLIFKNIGLSGKSSTRQGE